MPPALWSFAVSLCVSGLGTWLLAWLARRIGVVARIEKDRWHSSGEVPRLAGPALVGAMIPWLPIEAGLICGLACGIGVIDDIRPWSPLGKALALAVVAGLGAAVTGHPWMFLAVWFSCNAVNLLDHADGIAAAAAAGAFAALGTVPGWAGVGACAGFLLLNYPPARTFMGDSGSLGLGAVLAMIQPEAGPLAVLGLCAVPLLDAVFVTLRRLWRGERPWIGDTNHSGHILLRAGVPPRLLPLLYAAAAIGIARTAAIG
jgi:UDP-GlcNAc:undecaprenyl-phosphate GlcNAc-1-phosphate transferase